MNNRKSTPASEAAPSAKQVETQQPTGGASRFVKVKHGDEKLWVKAAQGAVLTGQVMSRETRTEVIDKKGTTREKVDYNLRVTGTNGLVMVATEEKGADGKAILRPAKEDELVTLTETFNISDLARLIGYEVEIAWTRKVEIKGGRSVWRLNIGAAPMADTKKVRALAQAGEIAAKKATEAPDYGEDEEAPF